MVHSWRRLHWRALARAEVHDRVDGSAECGDAHEHAVHALPIRLHSSL